MDTNIDLVPIDLPPVAPGLPDISFPSVKIEPITVGPSVPDIRGGALVPELPEWARGLELGSEVRDLVPFADGDRGLDIPERDGVIDAEYRVLGGELVPFGRPEMQLEEYGVPDLELEPALPRELEEALPKEVVPLEGGELMMPEADQGRDESFTPLVSEAEPISQPRRQASRQARQINIEYPQTQRIGEEAEIAVNIQRSAASRMQARRILGKILYDALGAAAFPAELIEALMKRLIFGSNRGEVDTRRLLQHLIVMEEPPREENVWAYPWPQAARSARNRGMVYQTPAGRPAAQVEYQTPEGRQKTWKYYGPSVPRVEAVSTNQVRENAVSQGANTEKEVPVMEKKGGVEKTGEDDIIDADFRVVIDPEMEADGLLQIEEEQEIKQIEGEVGASNETLQIEGQEQSDVPLLTGGTALAWTMEDVFGKGFTETLSQQEGMFVEAGGLSQAEVLADKGDPSANGDRSNNTVPLEPASFEPSLAEPAVAESPVDASV